MKGCECLPPERQAEDWQDLVRQARAQVEADLQGRELPPPEEILRRMREERVEQLLTGRCP